MPAALRVKQFFSSQASSTLLKLPHELYCVSPYRGTSLRKWQRFGHQLSNSYPHIFLKPTPWPKRRDVAGMGLGIVLQIDWTRYLNNFFCYFFFPLVVFLFCFSVSLSRLSVSCHPGLPFRNTPIPEIKKHKSLKLKGQHLSSCPSGAGIPLPG